MLAGGDVLGLVVGHDHVNNFVADCGGMDLIQTPGCTYNSYYNNMYQGARVIELDEADLTTYETYNLTSNELANRDGSQLGDMGGRDNYDFFYTIEKLFSTIYNFFVNFFKAL